MTADDRTPDTREVRSMYDAGSHLYRETPEQHYLGHPAPDYGAEFDRWLARALRDAKAEAWNECVRAAYAPEGRITHGPNPYETGDQA